jgi:tRNA pseudouridine38-40 synthase
MLEKAYFSAICQYDGTDYSGWQAQKDKKTVQGTIEKVIFDIWKIEDRIFGASRTDAGVHSEGQRLKLFLPKRYDENRLQKILNDHLPKDIFIKNLEACYEKFSPRYDAKSKIYNYLFSLKKLNPFESRYAYHYFYKCDLKIVDDILKIFIGTNDFSSFCSDSEDYSKIRTVYKCELVSLSDGVFKIVIEGNAFLRYMVRRIVGAALVSSTKNYSVEFIKDILNKKNPSNHLYTAPACGLILKEIKY